MRVQCFTVASSFLWIALILTGHSAAADPILPQTRAIVDMAGRTVKIPQAIHRIAVTCYGGASHELAVLGASEKIVAQPTMKNFPLILKMHPRFNSIPDAGSFDVVSVEYIMSLKPDLVLASVTATKGNKKIEAAGIPVVAVNTGRADVGSLLREFWMIGSVLGEEQKARALVQYWNDRLSLIQKRTGSVPEAKKKRVFYGSLGSSLGTEGASGWGQHFITASGGINVSKGNRTGGEVTLEHLLVWNPDVIITRKSTIGPSGASRNLPKDKPVYRCPTGAFWWDRPSPEAILGIIWLAKTLYPETMHDIDLKRETRSFYKSFYGYALSDSEYEGFFAETQ